MNQLTFMECLQTRRRRVNLLYGIDLLLIMGRSRLSLSTQEMQNVLNGKSGRKSLIKIVNTLEKKLNVPRHQIYLCQQA